MHVDGASTNTCLTVSCRLVQYCMLSTTLTTNTPHTTEELWLGNQWRCFISIIALNFLWIILRLRSNLETFFTFVINLINTYAVLCAVLFKVLLSFQFYYSIKFIKPLSKPTDKEEEKTLTSTNPLYALRYSYTRLDPNIIQLLFFMFKWEYGQRVCRWAVLLSGLRIPNACR